MLYQTLCYALAAALGRLKVLGGVLWPRVALAGILHSTIGADTDRSYDKLEIRSMERGICPIAVFYFALKRSFFNI